jgi:hypothetical protein
MNARKLVFPFALALFLSATAYGFLRLSGPGIDMSTTAAVFLGSLSSEQRATAQLDYDTPKRVKWHFIPLAERKGLQIKDMNASQRAAALALLRTALSESGYGKATQIMALEAILRELEKNKVGGAIRDPERYYFTVFGKPADDSRWGLSVEGHHLSLNFVVDAGRVTSSTPTFFGANPADVKTDFGDVKKGTRVLAQEEDLAFQLLQSLSPEQRSKVLLDPKAPKDIRAAGEAQPPTDPPAGISARDLSREQFTLLRQLIEVYAANLPSEVAAARMGAIEGANYDNVFFAWAGADKPGVGHYYRIQGPTFLIELNNTQPDASGNIANHIHSVWHDMAGDFALPIGK